jgi:glutamate 5-kinase
MRLVVKLGTSTLTGGTPGLSRVALEPLVSQVAALMRTGVEIVVVSSGAIAAGRERLGFPRLPKDIPARQMLAAVGQPGLMALWSELFAPHQLPVAQVLLTRADLADRRRYLNARNTLEALLRQGVVAIVNENDTVATEEIRVGDNDNLSALVANLVDADLLLLLTDREGLLAADPRLDPDARLVEEVDTPEIPESLWRAAGGATSGLGTGGMVTKLQAADLARRAGTAAVIARGSEARVLERVAAGERLGTRFLPTATRLESRKRYILAGGAAGRVTVDEGAARALARGSSLLPVGVTAVDGEFERGDTVRVTNAAGRELARGMVGYGSVDLARLCGKRSEEIVATLGYDYGDEVVHRNDMVLL